MVGTDERHGGKNQDPDHRHGTQSSENASDDVQPSDHDVVGLPLVILFLLTLAGVPLTLAAVAVRPSQATVRAAALTLLALPALVVLIIAMSAIV